MRNFDTDLDRQGATHVVKAIDTVSVTDTATVRSKPVEGRGFVGTDPTGWSWQDLRDYVVHEIEQRFGVFPRDPVREASIFKSFASRWGDRAGRIAVVAFEVHGGRWHGAPIAVTRFCKNSDPYFAEPIAQRLVEAPITGW